MRIWKIFILLFLVFVVEKAEGQGNVSANFGADLVSRYIWRGMDLGGVPSTPQFQPYLNLDFGLSGYSTLTLGAWGSYGFTGSYSESDLSVKYAYKQENFGTISFSVIDFYFPYEGLSFFNYNNDGTGSHVIEADLAYDGDAEFPIHLLVASNLVNRVEGDKTLYAEIGYTVKLNDYDLYFVAGGAQGKSSWNQVNDDTFAITNLGITAAKNLSISNSYNIPVAISYIINPHQKISYIFVKATLF